MHLINALLADALAAVLSPFRSAPALIGLTLVAVLSAAGVLLVIGWAPYQARIARLKRALVAALYEMMLFNHDLRAIARAQVQIFALTGQFVVLSLVPLVLTSVPMLMVMAHLNGYYGYAGLTPGEPVLMTIQMNPGPRPRVDIEAPDGLAVTTPVVWIPSLNEALCFLVANRVGEYVMTVRVDSQPITKTVVASDAWVARSPVRTAGGFASLVYPAERPLSMGQRVTRVSLDYADRDLRMWNRDIHWSWVFLVLSIISAFSLKGVFVVLRSAARDRYRLQRSK